MTIMTFKQDEEQIEYDSHVRIKHKETKTWLHLNKGKQVISEIFALRIVVLFPDFRYFTDEGSNNVFDILDETGNLFKVCKIWTIKAVLL